MLVSVRFDTLCRRGELVALSIGDLPPNATGRYSVLVRRAKNGPEGADCRAHLLTRTSPLMREWLTAIKEDRGPLLRPAYRSKALGLYLEALMGNGMRPFSVRPSRSALVTTVESGPGGFRIARTV